MKSPPATPICPAPMAPVAGSGGRHEGRLLAWGGTWLALTVLLLATAPLPGLAFAVYQDPRDAGRILYLVVAYGWIFTGIPALSLATVMTVHRCLLQRSTGLWAGVGWTLLGAIIGTAALGAVAPYLQTELSVFFIAGGGFSAMCASVVLWRLGRRSSGG